MSKPLIPSLASQNYSSRRALLIHEEKFDQISFPYKTHLSFKPLVDFWRNKVNSQDRGEALIAREVIQYLERVPHLAEPIDDYKLLDQNDDFVEIILAGIFPAALRKRHLGFVIPPFSLKGFYFTPRLSDLLLSREIKFGFGANQIITQAIMVARAGALVLNRFYDQNISIDIPFNFVMRPTGTQLEKYYRSELINDFVHIKQLKPLKPISQEQINKALGNIYDTRQWLEFIPADAFSFEGMVVANLVDMTEEDSISRIKQFLLGNDALINPEHIRDLQIMVRNYLNIPDLRLGVKSFDYNNENWNLTKYKIEHNFLKNSNLFAHEHQGSIYDRLIKTNSIIVEEALTESADPTSLEVDLLNEGIQSIILAPLNDDKGVQLGFLEIGTPRNYGLNSLHMLKLSQLIPLFEIAVERSREEIKNRIQAIIRENYTNIHPSVEWKFIQTAYNFLEKQEAGVIAPSVEPIVFDKVYPLYGQADVVSSSTFRNSAIRDDYLENLQLLQELFQDCRHYLDFPIINQYQWEISQYIDKLTETLTSSDEVRVYRYLHDEVHIVLKHMAEKHPKIKELVKKYLNKLDPVLHILYRKRKDYEDSINHINRTIGNILEERNQIVQRMLPHYFQKFKTDGYEFELFVGQSLLKLEKFEELHLKNLRLWQLTTLAEIARTNLRIQNELPCPMMTAQILLVYSSEIRIKFRTDEKCFDVDGTYNLDYEIIKKRIDKAYLAESQERLRKAGHIAVIYMQDADKTEYTEYLQSLITKGYLEDPIENLEVEKLQGVEGLRALRVKVKV